MEDEEKVKRPARRTTQSLDLINVPNALLRVETVAELTGLGVRTIWTLVSKGLFPEPLHLVDPYCTRWPSQVIEDYLRRRVDSA